MAKKKITNKKVEGKKSTVKVSKQGKKNVSSLKETKQKKKVNVKAKPKQKISMEAKNAMEVVQEILSPCIKCGMCKSLCPVFKTLKREEVSPRGHAIMLNENILNDLVFQCNLCKACEKNCPLNLKICDAMKKARESLVLRGDGLKTNEEMMKIVRKNGSPFEGGDVNPDKLYCC